MRPLSIVALGALLMLGVTLLQQWFVESSLFAAMGGAALAEFGGGKIGVAWNPPVEPRGGTSRVQRALRAAGGGVLLALVVWALGFALGGLATHGSPLWSALGLGLVEITVLVMIEEILHRGVLRILCKRTEPRMFVPMAALLAAVVALGRFGVEQPWAIAAQMSLAVTMALLWELHQGGLLAIVAHASFAFVLGPLSSSIGLGLSGQRWLGVPLTTGPLACLVMVVAALALALHARRAREASPPDVAS